MIRYNGHGSAAEDDRHTSDPPALTSATTRDVGSSGYTERYAFRLLVRIFWPGVLYPRSRSALRVEPYSATGTKTTKFTKNRAYIYNKASNFNST